jgi:hypothetical protein
MKVYQFNTFKEAKKVYGSVIKYRAVMKEMEKVREQRQTVLELFKYTKQGNDLRKLAYIWPWNGDK